MITTWSFWPIAEMWQLLPVAPLVRNFFHRKTIIPLWTIHVYDGISFPSWCKDDLTLMWIPCVEAISFLDHLSIGSWYSESVGTEIKNNINKRVHSLWIRSHSKWLHFIYKRTSVTKGRAKKFWLQISLIYNLKEKYWKLLNIKTDCIPI